MTTSWDDLAVAALLGTDRRTVDLAALPGPAGQAAAGLDRGDAAAALLDGAALLSAYRRGGLQREAGARPPDPAAPETRRTVSAAAAARLDSLLATGHRELVAEWIGAAAAAGLVAPPAALPALLDIAILSDEHAAAVRPVLGRRGAWLIAFRAHWQKVASLALADAQLDGTLPDHRTWQLGDSATRRAWFTRLRGADPARARDLLAASWARETGEDREALLAALDTGLSAADEPLLEPALDDRRGGVRERAALLLSRLPTSAYAGRMRARARDTVVVERKLLRSRIVVQPPAEYDAAMQRDGLVLRAGQSPAAQRALLVPQIVDATPLEHWTTMLRTSPEGVLRTPLPADWRANLVEAWARAARRQRDPRWALALVPHVQPVLRRDLIALLPPGERGDSVAALFGTRHSPNGEVWLTQALDDLPAPWPEPVAMAVLAWLAAPDAHADTMPVRSRLDLAGRRLPAALAGRVAALAATMPDGSPWRAAVSGVAGMLAYRHATHEELR